MSGGGLQLVRNHGGDRWYGRRRGPGGGYVHGHGQVWREQFPARAEAVVGPRRPVYPPQEVAKPARSNLDRFVEATAPAFLSEVMDGRIGGGDFNLKDLWEGFKEWSAYGAGVPLMLNEAEPVVQYYVPYLSGIQIYSDQSRCSGLTAKEEGDDITFVKDHANMLKMADLSLKDRSKNCSECSSCSDNGTVGTRQGNLLFEFLEGARPFCRQPLADKIANLSAGFPELMTLRSCDISSSSWMAVAWYPIYRIPTGSTLRDFDACFLTFHFLSTPRAAASNGAIVCPRGNGNHPRVVLPSFGLSWYKYNSSLWSHSGGAVQQSGTRLLEAADKWLKNLRVELPDHEFFSSNGAYRRF